MDQVSRPLLVVLLAVVVLAASWMAFLRPRAVESTVSEVTAPAQVATQAAKAAAETDKASAATEAATAKLDESTATPTPAAPVAKATEKAKAKAVAPAPAPAAKAEAKKAAAAPKGQAAVLQAMDAGKVVVLLFFDKAGADDRAARDSVKDLHLRDGKVFVQVADVKDVGRYDSVTQGVTVTQSPTTLIIAPDGKARVVTGLTDPTEVDQLVRAALTDK